MLAYVLGTRTDKVFLKLKILLEPFGISKFYTNIALQHGYNSLTKAKRFLAHNIPVLFSLLK